MTSRRLLVGELTALQNSHGTNQHTINKYIGRTIVAADIRGASEHEIPSASYLLLRGTIVNRIKYCEQKQVNM